jgi:transcriptional regulator of acetoin/glycerol metabolism
MAAAYKAGSVLDRKDLNRAMNAPADARPPHEPVNDSVARKSIYRPEELQALQTALEQAHGNLTKAAAAVGLSRSRAYRMLYSRARP